MVKKKVLAMTLLTTLGLAGNSLLAEEVQAEEKINNENRSKKEENKEEEKELSIEEVKELDLNKSDKKDEKSIGENLKENTKEEKKEITKKSKQLKKGKVINVTSYLKIRTKASTNSEVKGTLKSGETFDIESKEGIWYKISYKGIKGYIHSDYVKEITENSSSNNSNNSNSTNSNTNSPNNSNVNKTGQVVNVSSSLRIREKASTSSAILGNLKANEKVDIISENNGWYKVKKGSITGYVSSSYIKIISNNSNNSSGNSDKENTSSDNVTINKSGQVVNVSSSLRIRSEANTSSNILGHLKANEKVDIINKSNNWYKIKKGSITGYVSSNYIKIASSSSNNNSNSNNNENSSGNSNTNTNTSGNLTMYKKAKEGKLHNVSTNLRMRSNPSTSANVVAYLLPTDKILIEGESGSWYYINVNGKKGYAHKDYIKEGALNLSGTGSTQNNSSKYNQVLNIMKAQIGSPYVFGGNGEIITSSLLNSLKRIYPTSNYNVGSKYLNGKYKAFDCSGLMRWSFSQVGINLGRTTYSQINNGYEVKLGSIKPGDLLFYSDLNHVGMYVGGDQWLESPRSGEYVRITNVPWKRIGRARRVL